MDTTAPRAHRFTTLDGTSLHYLDWGGSGSPVILLHGLSGRSTGWSEVAERLRGGHRVVAPDLRGHGDSGKPAGPYSAEAFTADLIALLDHLGWPQANLVGHSLGGRIALCAAAWHPARVDRIVVEEGDPAAMPGAGAAWEQNPMLRRSFPSRREAVEVLRAERGETSGRWWGQNVVEVPGKGTVWAFSAEAMVATARDFLEADQWGVLDRVCCPVLLLCGEHGDTQFAGLVTKMAGRLPGHPSPVVFPEASHWVHHDSPDAYVRHVERFLASPA
ncbi:MAG: alpha/beta fold hydrolase [Bacillota bacterium]